MPHGDLAEVQSPHNERLYMLTGVITTTTSGTIGSQDCVGFTAARTAAGRYVITLTQAGLKLMYGHAAIEGHATAAAAAAKGQVAQLRSVSPTTKAITVQIMTPSLAAGASVDVDVEDAAKIRILLVVSRGKC